MEDQGLYSTGVCVVNGQLQQGVDHKRFYALLRFMENNERTRGKGKRRDVNKGEDACI